MATIATNHVTVAMGQVATTSLHRYSHFFSNYIIPSHYDQMLFFSVYQYWYNVGNRCSTNTIHRYHSDCPPTVGFRHSEVGIQRYNKTSR